jgi:acyl-coenzyme A thioesterase PaaI-like protein
MSAEQNVVPDGYVPHVRTSPVIDPWQPLFAKIAGGTVSLALRIRAAHCNGKGFMHGGVISALADNAMELSIIETLRHQGISRVVAARQSVWRSIFFCPPRSANGWSSHLAS